MDTKIIYKIILILFINYISYCQSGWFLQNSGTVQSLTSVFFVNPNTGFVTGNLILKTTNGGNNWFILNSAPASSSVFFTNGSTGYLGSGHIFKSTDEGTSWTQITFTNIGANDIFFLNPITGWAAFSNIYKSTNSGNNWEVPSSVPGNSFGNIRFSDENTGYAVWQYGSITKTTDGGITWSAFFKPGNIGWFTAFPVDNNTVFLSGSNRSIAKTTNGGLNWSILNTGVNNNLYSAYYLNADTGYVVGSGQLIMKTINGGLNWDLQNGVNSNTLNKVFFINSLTGWAVGDNGTILKTTSGGTLTSIEPVSNIIPSVYGLSQNYPNPFNPSTKIKFQIPSSGSVAQTFLSVYDILGREVATLVNQQLQPGAYEIEWDASNFPSGVYFYKLSIGDPSSSSGQGFTETKKMVLIK